MRAAIIGASEESLHTIEKAHELGLDIIALDGNPNAEGLKHADIPMVVDISDVRATIEAIKEHNVDFILTIPIGRYLTTIGAVNDALNLPGISEEMAIRCTDKFIFHRTLANSGLRPCNCYLIDKNSSTNTNEYNLSFPAILKPRYGSGSRGIHYIDNPYELADAIKATRGEDYVLEDCVDGDEYGIDGSIINGVFHLILLRKKDNTPLPSRQAVAYYAVSKEDSFYKDVTNYCAQITKALGLSECLVHGDIIKTPSGPFAVEVSARPSGHNLHNLFTPLCSGIDMAEEYIKYRMGMDYSFSPSIRPQMMIHYFDYEGLVTYVPDKDSIVNAIAEYKATLTHWVCNIKEGEYLQYASTGHSLMSRGYYIVIFDNEGSKNSYGNASNVSEKVKELFAIC